MSTSSMHVDTSRPQATSYSREFRAANPMEYTREVVYDVFEISVAKKMRTEPHLFRNEIIHEHTGN